MLTSILSFFVLETDITVRPQGSVTFESLIVFFVPENVNFKKLW
jgi:hypothetical protein